MSAGWELLGTAAPLRSVLASELDMFAGFGVTFGWSGGREVLDGDRGESGHRSRGGDTQTALRGCGSLFMMPDKTRTE